MKKNVETLYKGLTDYLFKNRGSLTVEDVKLLNEILYQLESFDNDQDPFQKESSGWEITLLVLKLFAHTEICQQFIEWLEHLFKNFR